MVNNMTYEEYKKEIVDFFLNINKLTLEQDKDSLSKEKIEKLEKFDETYIIFYNQLPLFIEDTKLYINNNYFKKDGVYNKEIIDASKRMLLEKYFEKFIIFDYSKDKEEPMMKYIVEDECNKFIKRNNLNIKNNNTYQNEYILILIKNKIGIKYNEYVYKKNVKDLINNIDDETIKQEYYKLQNKKKINDLEKKDELEQISKIYNIDLKDIEVINAKGKKYYKIKKDNTYKLIEANTNLSIIEEYKSVQNENKNYQTDNTTENTNNITENLINKKIDVSLIPINELPNYKDILANLSPEQINCVKMLFINREKYNISLINIYDGIAIDKSGNCIFAEKNIDTGEYEIKDAKTDKYTNSESNDSKETKNNSNNNQNDEKLENNNNFENSDTNEDTDTLYHKEEIQNEQKKGYQKKLILNKYYQNGFVNILVLSLITGFISGLSIGILFILMK